MLEYLSLSLFLLVAGGYTRRRNIGWDFSGQRPVTSSPSSSRQLGLASMQAVAAVAAAPKLEGGGPHLEHRTSLVQGQSMVQCNRHWHYPNIIWVLEAFMANTAR